MAGRQDKEVCMSEVFERVVPAAPADAESYDDPAWWRSQAAEFRTHKDETMARRCEHVAELIEAERRGDALAHACN